jgi:hypothetical protein
MLCAPPVPWNNVQWCDKLSDSDKKTLEGKVALPFFEG